MDNHTLEARCDLSVIIAEEMSAANLAEIFASLRPENWPNVEFILCSGSNVATLLGVPDRNNVRIIPAPTGTRIPLLWRDGILAAKADKVALTTAHCVPSATWVEHLLSYPLQAEQVAVGGAIANRDDDDAVGRAIYLLRYVRYTTAHASGSVNDIAADNALYRKADILAHPDLLDLGFWEPSFHERFVAQGLQMQFDNQLIVVHKNCYSIRGFMWQRFSHGIEFGMARAKQMSRMRRLTMILLSPLIPLVFANKILAQAKGNSQFELAINRDLFWLMIFILAWATGETIGYLKKVE